MNDTPEMIRQQIDETRMRLAAKLELLEDQFSETVQTTETAVNATVGAVQDVVHYISDIRRFVDKHPWLVLGGSVALGYLAIKFSNRSTADSVTTPQEVIPAGPSANKVEHENGKPAVDTAAIAEAIKSACESSRQGSSRQQLKDLAISALIGVAQDIAHQAVPPIVDYLASKPDYPRNQPRRQRPELDQWEDEVSQGEPAVVKPRKTAANKVR